jgi:hypothetical protein
VSTSVNNSRYAGLSKEETAALARRSVTEFNKLRPTLLSYARTVTGRRDITLQLTHTGAPRTDGTAIMYPPPLALGDPTPHITDLCARRDKATQRQLCYACHIRDSVLADIYHELGHIVGESHESITDYDKAEAVRLATLEVPGAYAKAVREKLGDSTFWSDKPYKMMASAISRWLPHIYNGLEDARVNALIFKERKGLRTVFAVNEREMFEEGIPLVDPKTGEPKIFSWSDADPSIQMLGALYVLASGYKNIRGWFSPEVVEALKDPQLKAICAKVEKTTSTRDVFTLGFAALDRLRELGFCKLPDDPTPPSPEEDSQEEESDDVGSGEGSDVSDSDETDGGDQETQPESGRGDPEGDDADDDGDNPEVGTSDEGDEQPETPASDCDSPGESPGMDSPGGSGDEAGDQSDGEDSPGSSDSVDVGAGDDSEPDLEQDDSSASEAGDTEEGVDDSSGGSEADQGDGKDLGDESGTSGSKEGSPPEDGSDSDASGGADPSDSGSEVPERRDREGADSDVPDSGSESGNRTDSDGAGSSEAGDDQDDQDGSSDRGSVDQSDEPGEPGEPVDDERGDAPSEDASEADTGDPSESYGEGPSDEGSSSDSEAGSGESGGSGVPQGDGSPVRGDERGESSDDSGVGDSGSAIPGGGGESAGGSMGEDEPGVREDSHMGDELPSTGMDGDPDALPDSSGSELGDEQGDESDDYEGSQECGADSGETPNTFDLDPATAAELEQVLEKLFGHHLEDESEMSEDEQQLIEAAINTAIAQAEHFDNPSDKITGVRERHEMMPRGYGSSATPVTVPESVLGKALLTMRTVLDDNKRARQQRNLKSGHVNRRALARRAPVQDERLFQKKIIPAKKDYFVLIGLDVSGSTAGGDRIDILRSAGAAQAEVCHRLGLKFAVYAHTGGLNQRGTDYGDDDANLDIWVIKDPHEPWSNAAKAKLGALRPGAMNLDGHTLEYYRKVCDRVQATDKIIMYYSDGGMPMENYFEELTILKREIETCRKKGYTLMGVGVHSSAPTEHGLDTVKISSVDQVKDVVLHLKKRLVQ